MTTPLTLETISQAPKALLHDHLDGGLRPSTVLELAGIDDRDPADTLRDGTAMDRFRRLVAAQGGDLTVP